MASTTADIQSLIDSYVPASLEAHRWANLAPVVRSWVTAAAPGHPHRARQLLAAGAQLAAWCEDNAVPLETGAALKASTIERYCALAERDGRHSTTTRATIRARLRYLAAAQTVPGEPPRPSQLRRGRVKPPYSAHEVAGFRTLARAQPPLIAARLEAMLVAGVGAGCGSEELRHLTGAHITTRAEGTVLATLLGRGRRTIAVDARYGPPLAALAVRAGDQLLIGGQTPDRRAVTSRLLQRIKGGGSLPPLEPGRLRSTWIVDRLAAGARLDVVMWAAGLTTPTTIVDLSRHLPPIDTEIALGQLQAPPLDARQSNTAAGEGRCDCRGQATANGRRA